MTAPVMQTAVVLGVGSLVMAISGIRYRGRYGVLSLALFGASAANLILAWAMFWYWWGRMTIATYRTSLAAGAAVGTLTVVLTSVALAGRVSKRYREIRAGTQQ